MDPTLEIGLNQVHSLYTNTDIVVHPQVSTTRINLRIPFPEARQVGSHRVQDGIAAVSRLDLVVVCTGADDSGHLRLRPDGCVGDVHANIVAEPEVRAFCRVEEVLDLGPAQVERIIRW